MVPRFAHLLTHRQHATLAGRPKDVSAFADPLVGLEAAGLVPTDFGVETRRRLIDEEEFDVQHRSRRRVDDDLALPRKLTFGVGRLRQNTTCGGLAHRVGSVASIEVETIGEVAEGPGPAGGRRCQGRQDEQRRTQPASKPPQEGPARMPSHAGDDSVPPVGVGTKSVTLLVAAGLAACGSDPRLRVDGSVLERISVENRLLLFDAENELDIAIDDRDQLLEELRALDGRRRATLERREDTERDARRFRDDGDAARAEIAELRGQAAEAQLDHLEARQRATTVRLERQARVLVVAEARFELAKARLVKRNNVPGAADLRIEDFEAQVDKYRERVDAFDERLAEAEARVSEREAAWSMAATRLRQASRGAYGSRWLD